MTPRHRIRRVYSNVMGRHVWRLYTRRDGILAALWPWEHISSHDSWPKAMEAARRRHAALDAARRWADQWSAGQVPLRALPPAWPGVMASPNLERAAREHYERMTRHHG